MKVLTIALLYIAFLSTSFAGECTTATYTQTADNKVGLDQTHVEDEEFFLNHVITIVAGAAAGMKIVKTRCIPMWTTSFYMYNGAAVADAGYQIINYFNHKEGSNQILEADLDEALGPQIAALEKAAQITDEQYKAAKKKEEMMKILGTVRTMAVVSAGIEFGISKIPVPPRSPNLIFVCLPRGTAAAISTRITTGGVESTAAPTGDFQAVNQNGLNGEFNEDDSYNLTGSLMSLDTLGSGISRTVTNVVMKALLKEFAGERSPLNRMIYYGAQELIAKILENKTGEVASCYQRRASEYRRLAVALRQRELGGYTTAGGGTGPGTTGVETTFTGTELTNTEFIGLTPDDFRGCTSLGSNGANLDFNCACRDNNSCLSFQGITGSTFTGGEGPLSTNLTIPDSFLTSSNLGTDFLNGTLSGNFGTASVAGNRLLGNNGAIKAKLNSQLNKIRKNINDKRKKKGLKPVDFDAESSKLARKFQKATKKALNGLGIKNMSDFNKAMGFSGKSGNAILARIKNNDKNNEQLGQQGESLIADVKGKEGETSASIGGDDGNKNGVNGKSSNKNDDFLSSLFGEEGSGNGSENEKGRDIASLDEEDSLDNYEISKGNEITKNPDVDIFDIITSRYFKTAYPVFFELN